MCTCTSYASPHHSPPTKPPFNHAGEAAEPPSGTSGPAFALHKDVYEVLLYAVEHSTASTNDREKIAKLWRDFFKVQWIVLGVWCVCVLVCAGGEGVSLWFCGFVCARSTVHRPSPNTHTHPFHTLNLTPQTAGLLLPSRHRPRGPRPRRGHPPAHRCRLQQRGGRRRRCRGARGGAGPVLAGGGGELPGVADAVRVIFVVVDGWMGVRLSLRSSGGPALSARDRPGDSTANHQLSTRNAPQLNQTSYVMMRLHHLLYERLQTAREICEQARDAKGASAAHPLKVSVFECLFVGLVRPPFRRRPSATTDPARNHLHSHLNFRGTDVCTHTYTRKRE